MQPSASISGASGRTPPIAVVGVDALFPGAATLAAFWRDVLEGKDRLTDVPRTHWILDDYFDARPGTPDKVYVRRGGFLPEVDFSPIEFGLPPNALPATDTAQLLALLVAKRVLAEATQGRWESMDRSRMSVVLGVASATELAGHMWGRLQIPVAERAMRSAGLDEDAIARVRGALEGCYVPWQETTFPGLLGNVVAGRIANRLDLGGTNAVVDAACASSLAAVDIAVNELALGRSDLAIAGGVNTLNDILMFMCFAQTGALSPTGDCRPFSDDADGTMMGEGIGMLALRRLEDAERDGDPIYAVIRGIGSSSDGRYKSIYAPSAAGQVLALRRAYERAGYDAGTVELVEGHGTGTKAGDVAEVEALRTVFEAASERPRRCALGSVKAQIGHTKAAAGAAGLIKCVMALHHKVLPPTIKVSAPNPALGGDAGALYLNTETRPWVRGGDHPRRASVSSLGFGGTNFHVTVEEYRGPAPHPPRLRTAPSELVVLAAEDVHALGAACRGDATNASALSSIARRTQLAFDPTLPARLAIVATDAADLRDKLHAAAEALEKGERPPRGIHLGRGAASGPVAFLFPGQGSQYVGMGGDLAVHLDGARAVWDAAADVPTGALERIPDRAFPPPVFDDEAENALEERLRATEWAQPAIAAASLSMLRIVERLGLEPVCVAGHSLGELTALAATGVMDAGDLLAVARKRGELASEAALHVPGAMTAVVAARSEVERVVARVAPEIVIANHNAPDQVVLSGPTPAIESIERALAAERIATRRLPVSTAFHSPLVAAASQPFRDFLGGIPIGTARVPVLSNATAAPYPSEPEAVRDALARAIASPVRFAEQVEAMYAAGARTFVEIGPESVLTKLVGRCLGDRPFVAVALDTRGKHGLTALWDALGRLSAAGVPLHFAALWEGEALPDETTPRAASRSTVTLSGTNYGKPSLDALPAPAPRLPAEPSFAPMGRAPVVPLAATEATGVGGHAGISAMHELHARTIAAQMEYQRLMAESHTAFLRAVEASYASLGQALGAPHAARAPAMPMAPAIPITPAIPIAPRAAAVPTAVAISPAPLPPAALAVDVAVVILAAVADKTGYPAEMIELGMDLEADLGVDSIKRVEILSAVRERAPGLPELDAAKMSNLRTLREIVDYFTAPVPERAAEGQKAEPAVALPERFAVRAVPAPALGLALHGLFGPGPVVVTPDGGRVAGALVERLRTHGIPAVVADAVTADTTAVLWLGGLRPVRAPDDAFDVSRDAFATARAVAPRFRERGDVFVTVQDTGGDFGLGGLAGDRAWLGGIAALAKTARAEWPLATVRAIDVERGGRSDEAIADALLQELLFGAAETEVGLGADGARRVLTSVAAPTPPFESGVEPGAVFVVSGGARGVTAAALIELARTARPRLLLFGRTPFGDEPPDFHGVVEDAELKRTALAVAKRQGTSAAPTDIARKVELIACGREIRETLRALRAAGAEARYVAADVRDPALLAPTLEAVRREWGPIRGLVHGAGVVADALIGDKTDAQFTRVWDTKVLGLRALLEATSGDPLRWLCLFSSAAAREGNAGQADYAMANEVLNKVAHAEARRRGNGCRVVSIGWGPWEGGMVTQPLRKHFESRGVTLLPIAAGAAAFVRELEGTGDVEVVIQGNGGLHGPEKPALQADIRVNQRTWPELGSHRIQGKVVLPMVVVLEWFARLTRPLDDGRVVHFRDLRVLRGIQLERFEGEGDRFHLVGRPGKDGQGYTLELRDEQGVLRCAATRDFDAPLAWGNGHGASDLGESPWSAADLYQPETLFHGPAFQVLRSVEGVSSKRARALLGGARDVGWPVDGWLSDAAALDGALQLALLFGIHAGSGQTLPMRIGRIVYEHRTGPGPFRCELTELGRTKERSVYDLSLTDAHERRFAELSGVEMFTVPGNTTASS